MYVVDLNKWKMELVRGQEQFVVDRWLEIAARDASPLFQPPVYSTLQLLKNFGLVLTDVDAGVLDPYHLQDCAEELRHRLHDGHWLRECLPHECSLLLDELLRVISNSSDVSTRLRLASLLRGTLNKSEVTNALDRQFQGLRKLTADSSTSFAVLDRALEELLNDLLHLGHSRAFVHSWMVAKITDSTSVQPYVDRFQLSNHLGPRTASDYEVLLGVFAPKSIPPTDDIIFVDTMPERFSPVPLLTAAEATSRPRHFALINITNAMDWFSAAETAGRILQRYFESTRLDYLVFNRTIMPDALVYDLATHQLFKHKKDPPLRDRRISNDDRYYRVSKRLRNERTYNALDRVLYWVERSRKSADEPRLIALWTAMEFLFSSAGMRTLDAMIKLVPAYICPQYPRQLLLDFWRFLRKTRPDGTTEITASLQLSSPKVGDLVALAEEAFRDDSANKIKSMYEKYPIVLRKWRLVRRLNPNCPRSGKSLPLCKDLEAFSRSIKFDLRSCYRARNRIIHDAATDVVQLDRLSQQLDWFLGTAVDTLLYQATLNPTLSLSDLHAINYLNYEEWIKALSDVSNPIDLHNVIQPSSYFLNTKQP
jgi:hypothetical protein